MTQPPSADAAHRHLIQRDEALRIAYRLGIVRLIATGLEALDAAHLATEQERMANAEQILTEHERSLIERCRRDFADCDHPSLTGEMGSVLMRCDVCDQLVDPDPDKAARS